ncbi:LAMI_0E15192g1_1 [Lachancea mirantina]|uniref:LAMI_0E15192g1_1 n=1 Tax=Lachancea mirantina TaxID=1230905 RepID=A0A1G4JS82_9SACH|nr:LAMI_0E15192g1_1 [Lachancea mirantina]
MEGLAPSENSIKRTRSRAGCYTCRLRRKKCNEVRPKCDVCSKNMLKCIWPEAGHGRLTKEMRERMKREVDFYDEFSRNGISGPRESKLISGNSDTIEYASIAVETSNKIESPRITTFVNYTTGRRKKFVRLGDEPHIKTEYELDTANYDDNASVVTFMSENDDFFSANNGRPADGATPQSISEHEQTFGHKSYKSSPELTFCTSTVHLEDDTEFHGLDEEQTERFYRRLMQQFVFWSDSCRKGKRGLESQAADRLDLTGDELLLYYTCIHYFLPAVGPQHTVPALTTTETFVPLLAEHPIVTRVFLCCGATFLAWCQPDKYSDVAEALYQESRAELTAELESNRTRGDETWAFACFQLLCLTDKLHNGSGPSMVDRSVDNLGHSFLIIKHKRQTIKNNGSSPTERMLIESFIYNYAVSLLVAQDVSRLPDPFGELFHELVLMLKSPIFDDCDVEWMNNPVLGPSVDAFEMLAQVSYMSRLPLPLRENVWKEKAQGLLNECLYYTPPALPPEIRKSPGKYAKYRPGLLCGSIISKACYLLVSKILKYEEFNLREHQIQGVVHYAVQSLQEIEKGNPLLCILLWSLLVIGAFTVDPGDRLVIKEYLKSTSETIHSYGAEKINHLLLSIWEGENLNLLFSRDRVSQVII